jgi:hypothetical protein
MGNAGRAKHGKLTKHTTHTPKHNAHEAYQCFGERSTLASRALREILTRQSKAPWRSTLAKHIGNAHSGSQFGEHGGEGRAVNGEGYFPFSSGEGSGGLLGSVGSRLGSRLGRPTESGNLNLAREGQPGTGKTTSRLVSWGSREGWRPCGPGTRDPEASGVPGKGGERSRPGTRDPGPGTREESGVPGKGHVFRGRVIWRGALKNPSPEIFFRIWMNRWGKSAG